MSIIKSNRYSSFIGNIVKHASIYPFQILLLLLLLLSLTGCTAQNKTTSQTDSTIPAASPSEEQHTTNPRLLQLLAEPVPLIPYPNSISNETIDDLTFLTRFGKPGQKLLWSPDNKFFTITSPESISLYDSKSFTLINEIQVSDMWEKDIVPEGFYFNNEAIAFSPNGNVLAFSALKNKSRIILVDVSTMEILEIISLNIENLSTFTFSTDTKKLVGLTKSVAENGASIWNVFFYDLSSAETTFLLDEAMAAEHFQLSPDGTMYITGQPKSPLSLYNTGTGALITKFENTEVVSFIQISPNNQFITVGYQNNQKIIWDTLGNQVAILKTNVLWPYISSIAYTPTGELLAIADTAGQIDVFDVKSGQQIRTINTEYTHQILSFNPDGSILSSATSINGAVFWTTDQDLIANAAANQHPDEEIKTNFSSLPPDGYILYTDGDGMSVISEDGTFQQNISSTLQGIPISADGRILSILSPKSDDEYNQTNPHDFSGSINLLNGETKKPESLGAISPDLKWIAEADFCDPQINQLGIEAISTLANTSFCTYVDELQWIETDEVYESISRITWSPDASRLAFMKFSRVKPEYEGQDWSLLLSNGLFVTDTTCFLDPRTCDQKTKLAVFSPFKVNITDVNIPYLNWSPDGTFVVMNNGEMFVVSDLRNEYAWKLKKPPVELRNYYQYFGISPHNEWIAYSGDFTNILLQPLYKGEPIEIVSGMQDVQVLGWIMAPLLETGGTFKVLKDGNHTRIYAQVGFERQLIGTLYDGNTFTVLDGPVQEDGYTWWYIYSNVDGVEGWVTEFYDWYEKVE